MIPLSLDHMVVTVSDMDRACDFYARVLGAEIVTFGAGRKAVRIGRQKLNLHDAATAALPLPAAARSRRRGRSTSAISTAA